MSKIDQLINELCPNGVQFKQLGELGTLYGGLTGKSKNDFKDGNARFITYMNVFSNIEVDTNRDYFVKIGENERQRTLQKGDVLFTGSSENPDECGMSSVLVKEPEEPLYLNSFCFILRLNDKELFLPEFLKYLFRDTDIRKQIAKTASGVTRFNVSKKRFAKVVVPIPPIEVQREIADILDNFTQLEAELEAELEARRKQYEFYRNQLLTFGDEGGVRRTTLGEVGMFIRGNGLQKKDFTESGVGCIHYGQIFTHYGTYAEKTKTFVSPEIAKKARKAQSGNLVIATTSENDEDVCKAVAWLGDDEIAVSSDAMIYDHNENPKYISYIFQTHDFFRQKKKYISGTKVRRVSSQNLAKINVALPPRHEQDRIVSILDNFDSLVNSISDGLPAELSARRKQYEYYRTKLLKFQEVGV